MKKGTGLYFVTFMHNEKFQTAFQVGKDHFLFLFFLCILEARIVLYKETNDVFLKKEAFRFSWQVWLL